jgi:hypothetical protein
MYGSAVNMCDSAVDTGDNGVDTFDSTFQLWQCKTPKLIICADLLCSFQNWISADLPLYNPQFD